MSRESSSLTKLKNLAYREGIIPADSDAMVEEFLGASDRGCVLIMPAVTERSVESAIGRVLRLDMSNADKQDLFSQDGPLSKFSSKIALGYSMGLYGQKTRHDLSILRHLRNAFAHSRKPLRFEMEAVRDVCHTLMLIKSSKPTQFEGFPDSLAKRYEAWHKTKDARIMFEVTCHLIGSAMPSVLARRLRQQRRGGLP